MLPVRAVKPTTTAKPAANEDEVENTEETKVKPKRNMRKRTLTVDDLTNEKTGVLRLLPSKNKRKLKFKSSNLDPEADTQVNYKQLVRLVLPGFKLNCNCHQAEDTTKLLNYYESWTSALFPGVPFEEVTQKIERLSGKLDLQVTRAITLVCLLMVWYRFL
jgi:hypothetical protein